jgi:hypothetical protein
MGLQPPPALRAKKPILHHGPDDGVLPDFLGVHDILTHGPYPPTRNFSRVIAWSIPARICPMDPAIEA